MAAFQARGFSRSLNALFGENAFSASNDVNLTGQICRVNQESCGLTQVAVEFPNFETTVLTNGHDMVDELACIRQLLTRFSDSICLI